MWNSHSQTINILFSYLIKWATIFNERIASIFHSLEDSLWTILSSFRFSCSLIALFPPGSKVRTTSVTVENKAIHHLNCLAFAFINLNQHVEQISSIVCFSVVLDYIYAMKDFKALQIYGENMSWWFRKIQNQNMSFWANVAKSSVSKKRTGKKKSGSAICKARRRNTVNSLESEPVYDGIQS